jgi:hypothetical protein
MARERVVRELRRRGAGHVTEVKTGNVFELRATETSGRREVTLRVKTKSSGDWQTTTRIGEPREEKQAETKFWILLDTGQRGADGPEFFFRARLVDVNGRGRPPAPAMRRPDAFFVQLVGDLVQRHPLLEHPSNPHAPGIVLSVAKHM